jgi:hypothetical protein
MGTFSSLWDLGQHRIRNNVGGFWRLVNKERHPMVRRPLQQRLGLWRRGFLSESAFLYRFGSNSPIECVCLGLRPVCTQPPHQRNAE